MPGAFFPLPDAYFWNCAHVDSISSPEAALETRGPLTCRDVAEKAFRI